MARNSDYWKERMAALEDMRYQKSQAYYRDVQEQYRQASNSLQMDIERWYGRLAENNGISYASAKQFLKKSELEEFRWSVEQYIKAGEENGINGRWIKQLENASAKYHISYLEAMKLQVQQHAELLSAEFEGGLTEFLGKSFSDQFYRTGYEVTKGTGIGGNLVRWAPEKVDMLVRKPWARDGKNFSDRIWANKEKLINNLHTELAQCMIRGAPPHESISRLARVMNVSKSQAGNLIITESAAIVSAAQEKCFRELEVKEFEVVETLDGYTCDICQEMDGRHFPMSDFEVGVTAPPFHPRCRGCTCPYFDDEFTTGEERAARDSDTGKTVYVPSDMKYEDWKRKFVSDAPKMYLRIPDEVIKIKGITPKIKKQLDDAIVGISKEYDVHLKTISIEPAGKGDIFVSGWYNGNMGLVINEQADFNKVTAMIEGRYASGMFAGKSIGDYICHEMFHIMTYQDCATEQRYLAKYMQIEGMYDNLKGISKYADRLRSGNEALAEAFVRIRNGEEVSKLASVLVESYVGRWRK